MWGTMLLYNSDLGINMTPMEYAALGLCSVIFILGLLGSLLPIVPGTLIVWVGVITHRLWMGPEDSVTWKIVIIAGLLMLIGQIADFVLGAWGARKFGATWKGTMGAFLGFYRIFHTASPPLAGLRTHSWCGARRTGGRTHTSRW